MQFFSLFRYFLSFYTYHPKRNWVVLGLIQLFNINGNLDYFRGHFVSQQTRLKRAYSSSEMTMVRDNTLYFRKLMEK